MPYMKLFIILPLFAVIFQIYNYALTRKREEKQAVCRGLGIAMLTFGIVSLIFRDFLSVVAGLLLMMVGFRLIAHGLDRLDKTIFIDSYSESSRD